MRKVCTKTIDPFRPVCGMGTPTQAAPYYTRRDLPTLTLTTFRPACEMGDPTQAAPHKSRRDLPTLTLTTFRPACGFRPLAEAQKRPIKKGQWIFDNRPIVS